MSRNNHTVWKTLKLSWLQNEHMTWLCYLILDWNWILRTEQILDYKKSFLLCQVNYTCCHENDTATVDVHCILASCMHISPFKSSILICLEYNFICHSWMDVDVFFSRKEYYKEHNEIYLTLQTMGNPRRKDTVMTPSRKRTDRFLLPNIQGYSSVKALRTHSTIEN